MDYGRRSERLCHPGPDDALYSPKSIRRKGRRVLLYTNQCTNGRHLRMAVQRIHNILESLSEQITNDANLKIGLLDVDWYCVG